MGNKVFIEGLQGAIEDEYVDGAYGLGWRLLSCPATNIGKSKIVFLGLNPAGAIQDFENDGFSCEAGSSYEIEAWGSFPEGKAPLQKQVRSLFSLLDVPPREVLSGNLIPFRSPRFLDLPNSTRALKFSEKWWSKILDTTDPELVITMGNTVTHSVKDLLNIDTLNKHPSGWGKVSLYFGHSKTCKLVGLPHLSTFKLLSRKSCKPPLLKVFDL